MARPLFNQGTWRAVGNGVYSDVPQDVDHSHFRGFDKPEGEAGFLIAESIPHKPTRDLIAAAPALYDFVATLENDDGKIPAWLWAQRETLLARARGETP